MLIHQLVFLVAVRICELAECCWMYSAGFVSVSMQLALEFLLWR